MAQAGIGRHAAKIESKPESVGSSTRRRGLLPQLFRAAAGRPGPLHPSRRRRPGRLRCAGTVALGVALAAVAVAGAAKRMDSTRLAPGLCETTGGGRFVAIPGFPGERIDRRLLSDIRL